ncbi:hypothetical protein D3C71_1947070 [compost metagenome]
MAGAVLPDRAGAWALSSQPECVPGSVLPGGIARCQRQNGLAAMARSDWLETGTDHLGLVDLLRQRLPVHGLKPHVVTELGSATLAANPHQYRPGAGKGCAAV